MADNAGWATLDIIPSVKGLAKELEKQTSGDLTTAGKKGGKRYGDAAGREAASGFKARFQNGVRDLNPLGGVAVGAGLALGLKDIYTRASEAQQSVGGVQSVFKEYADSVIADSKRADQALGLSTTAYQELITVTGALLKNKGLTDYADQARQLVQVGADLAATYGGPTREAVEALNAAMRGESDPIERYAISLNETAVNALLAEQGLTGLEGAALDQAKASARLELIMRQSVDAQGAFARESDTAAGASARATAQFENMRTELGTKLLPAGTAFFSFLNDDALPALESAGGLAVDAAQAFRALPAPIQAATAAFAALRLSSATGLTDSLVGGVNRASSALDSLRLQAMFTADAYRDARTITRQFGDSSVRVSSGVGRLSASMSALQVGAQGAGTALRGSLSGAMGLLGGPWGIAIAGGTALLAKFWSEHQAAKAHVEDLTSSLNAQTGAITDNTEAAVFNALDKAGAITVARDFGIALADVREAALGNEDALARVNREIQAHIDVMPDVVAGDNAGAQAMQNTLDAADKLRGAIGGQNEAVRESIQGFRDQRSFMAESETATDRLTSSLDAYGDKIADVRSELQKLLDKEKERALNAIQNRRDQIAMLETFRAAREEAAEGKRTLNQNTQAGRENLAALLDIADQWANSKAKVTNAAGAYEEMRRKFITVAESMGGTRDEARKLADQLLKVPKNAPIEFQSKGYRERMREIAEIKAAMAAMGPATVDYESQGMRRPDGSGGQRPPVSSGYAGQSAGVSIGSVNVTGADWRDVMTQTQRIARRRGLGY